jgi:D-alanyl-D-alanine carboxypeptidase (penicillin-binding protein 5/6)
MRSIQPLLRRAVTAFAAACVASIALAAPAGAAVLDGDYLGGVKVAARPELRESAPDLYIPAGQLSTLDGRELWARDSEARRAMASTTKIMTAVVVLERANLDDVVTVGKVELKVGESAMGLKAGERITVRDLLQGMLIQSGNDAAAALAIHVGGSVEGFVKLMNEKASKLDMPNTHYLNPHGLDVPGHYTSAQDLTALSRYAMRIPEFRRIVGTYKTKTVTEKYTHVLTNHNLMLNQYAGAEGIKTGWTDEAGYCIVAAAKRGDIELVATVLGAASEAGRFGQATRLLDWGFRHYSVQTVVTSGERGGNVRVSDYVERTVPTQAAETTQLALFDLAGPTRRRIELPPDVPAPVLRGQRIGTMTVYQGDRLLAQVPLVAAKDVPSPTFWQRIGFFFVRLWRGIFGE